MARASWDCVADQVESIVRPSSGSHRRAAGGAVVSFAAVAKRVRYSGRPASKRSGSKRPSGSGSAPGRPSIPPSRPLPPEPIDAFEPAASTDELPRASSSHLTDAELRRAEELQAEMLAQERAAMAESIRRKTRARAGEAYSDDVNAPLKVRAAHEYAYVARDVRRIIVTGGIMVAILAVLAILVNGLGVISI